MGKEEIKSFLSHLAVDKNAAAATQNQALNAILFLYREVLKIELENIGAYLRAKRSKHLPTVLTKKVMVGAAIVSGLHPASLALSFVGGVVRGVDRYSKY